MTVFSHALLYTISSLLFFVGCSAGERSTENNDPVRLMSYNIRLDLEADGINRWDNRKEHALAMIRFYRPGFLGTQEGLINQIEYIDRELDGYRRIGAARDDGHEKGEFSSVHYDANRFELVKDTEQTLWLSETPDRPGSRGWDAALPRILTYGKFLDKYTGHQFYVFNTHYDHVGQTAREESTNQIIDTIHTVAGGVPVILLGDFNVTENNPVYEMITQTGTGLKDALYSSENPHVGPFYTFEGFEVKNENIEPRRIDYIFVSDEVTVLNHAILSTFRDGYYPSDHMPVFAEIRFN